MTHPVPYPAPYFSLVSSDGVRVSLKDFRGQWLVLYFYPQDNTPGCTKEACSFRDEKEEFENSGARIVGVSMDTPESHEAFKLQHKLNFTLVSDPRAEAAQAYGAWKKGLFGEELQRMTFIIDPQGMVQKVYDAVLPAGHGASVRRSLQELQTSTR